MDVCCASATSRTLPAHAQSSSARWRDPSERQGRRHCSWAPTSSQTQHSATQCRLGAPPRFDPSRVHVQFRVGDQAAAATAISAHECLRGIGSTSTSTSSSSNTSSSSSGGGGSSIATIHHHSLSTFQTILPRCYTVTHDDLSGNIFLAIGPETDAKQLQSFSTQFFRDEVVAEWRCTTVPGLRPSFSLHLHCHVSGGHALLAPGHLRNWIFEQEMPLVLQCICHADRQLLAAFPDLATAPVWIHFQSSNPALHRADCWGPLGLASQKRPNRPFRSMLGDLLAEWGGRVAGQGGVARQRLKPQLTGEGGEPLRYEAMALIWRLRYMPPVVVSVIFAFVFWLNAIILDIPLHLLDWTLLL